jgi:hypothetical protein
MASTLSPPIQAEFSEDRWPAEPSGPVDLDLNPGRFSRKRPSLGKRASRAFARLLITFSIGVGATLAWQSYGDAARQMIANSSPRLDWLAPRPAQTASDTAAPVARATLSPELLQLKAMTGSLEAMRQRVEQLAAQLAAGQQQMAGDIAKLQAAEQDIFNKISAPAPRPAAPPARKPAPRPTPPLSSEEPPER